METDSIAGNPDDLNLNNLVECDEREIGESKTSNVHSSAKPSLSLKKQPELLCNCPLHCDRKIGKEWRKQVYKQFQEIGDHAVQNQFIQRHIKIKSIAKRLWEEEIIEKKIQRRVTCKYLVPMTGSVVDSYSYSKTLTYDSVKFTLDTSWTKQNGFQLDLTKESFNVSKIHKPFSETPTDSLNSSPMLNSSSDISKDLSHPDPSDSFAPVNLSDTKMTNSFAEMPQHLSATKMTDPVCENPRDLSVVTMTNSFSELSGNPLNTSKLSNSNTSNTPTDLDSTMNETLPDDVAKSMSGPDPPENKRLESTAKDSTDVNSPLSFNDTDSVTTPDDANSSEVEGNSINPVKYVEVCQKAFMNMYGITEKRIRWQREKLILKSRILAERKRKELEEMDRTLSLARSLGAGCQPLFAFLEKSNCLHLSEQLMGAIEDDVALVNNFFHNQLWKPEDIMNKSIHVPSLDVEPIETECD